jgi:hypothetical protein
VIAAEINNDVSCGVSPIPTFSRKGGKGIPSCFLHRPEHPLSRRDEPCHLLVRADRGATDAQEGIAAFRQRQGQRHHDLHDLRVRRCVAGGHHDRQCEMTPMIGTWPWRHTASAVSFMRARLAARSAADLAPVPYGPPTMIDTEKL